MRYQDIKTLSYVKGKPKLTPFIDDYPLPVSTTTRVQYCPPVPEYAAAPTCLVLTWRVQYYILLRDMRALPSYLGDALRQWFELVTRSGA